MSDMLHVLLIGFHSVNWCKIVVESEIRIDFFINNLLAKELHLNSQWK